MAKPTTTTFGHILIYVGDGATPEVFTAPCGLTSKSLEVKSDTSSTALPDCDDPDAPAWNDTATKALSANVSGEGILAMESLSLWRKWVMGGASKNVRVVVNETLAKGGGMWSGAAVLTSFKVSADTGEKPKVSINIESDGQWIWTDAGA